MNYMENIAKSLGVEFGEEFYIKNQDKIYRFTRCGLEVYCGDFDGWLYNNQIVIYLLSGDYEIIKKPWKPKDGEFYYTIYTNLKNEAIILCCRWQDSNTCYEHYVLGNCFRTEKEAEQCKDMYTKWLRNKEPDTSWRK